MSRKSRNKIILKLEEETIFITEYYMKIEYETTSGECFKNKWFYMKYIGN